MKIVTEFQFTSEAMTNIDRIKSIVKRLSQYTNIENIFLFTHRRDIEGLNATRKVVEETGANLGYFMGFKKLISLKSQ